jgi:hypothetical protein
MSFRDDVDALAARHTSLERELADKTRELADAAHVLEEARAKRSLPILDNIRVATPCTASWDRMLGDERVRHCLDCNKNVYNLSAMTRDDAEALIVAKHGDLCARYFQRSDGTIMTSDCSVGVSRRRKRRLIAAGAVALLAGGGGILARAATRTPEALEHEHRHAMMGAIAPPPPAVAVPVAPQPLMGAVAVPTTMLGRIAQPHPKKP